MPTNRAFAYNPDHISVDGTYNIGDLAVGVTRQNYNTKPGGLTWWGSPDEEQGYVIAVPVSGNTQPTHVPPIGTVFASVKFLGTKVYPNPFSDSTFIGLAETYFNQSFTSATEASTWLTGNGFWNSYPIPVLSLDAGNPLSYPGTGDVWTDTIGGKEFILQGVSSFLPNYSPQNGGFIEFSPLNQNYAICSTSLPSLSNWTVGIWHYYDGTEIGALPCIVTETYPGDTGQINYSVGYNTDTGYLNAGFYNYVGWNISGGYVLTQNNWYYIVGTYDGSSLTLYINGTLVITNPNVNTNSTSSQGGIRLMKRWDNYDYWGGKLATVDIYSSALNQGEITSIWNNTKSRFGL